MKKFIMGCLIMLGVTAIVSAQSEPGLPTGMKAPDFEAVTYKNEKIKLSDIIRQGPVVLIFYRGGWCLYCNRQLRDLQSRFEDFKNFGATLIAVSVDLQENALKTAEENQLGFEVVSDPAASVLESYNLVFQVPDDLAVKYKNEYHIDLEASSGRGDHVIAVPAAYVIDGNGMIVYAYANRDYKVRADTDTLLEALKNLKQ